MKNQQESIVGLDILESGRRKNPVYHEELDRLSRFLIPPGARVLELGCATGRLLASLKPSYGLGLDLDEERIKTARGLFSDRPELEFKQADVEDERWEDVEPFDYIVMSDLLSQLGDVQATFERLLPVCASHTRLIVTFHSNLWRPVIALATLLGRRQDIPDYNWLSSADISNLLRLADFEVVSRGARTLLPLGVPLLESLANRFLAKLPLLREGCLTWYVAARPKAAPLPHEGEGAPSVSVVVPTRNEKGNIEDLFLRTPVMGSWTELVFVDGNSHDGTLEEIERCRRLHGGRWKRVAVFSQDGVGKGDAVRKGFSRSRGDLLMILDSDLTMPPEELGKYFDALAKGHGEFINGCRLVYPMEDRAMRFANMLGNHFFGRLFSYLLNQRVKDTLCGTKALWRRDYEKIAAGRMDFGELDPFGDFDLLLGASRLNLGIVDLPIRYRNRIYGDTKISRWSDGLLLLRMSGVAFKRLVLS